MVGIEHLAGHGGMRGTVGGLRRAPPDGRDGIPGPVDRFGACLAHAEGRRTSGEWRADGLQLDLAIGGQEGGVRSPVAVEPSDLSGGGCRPALGGVGHSGSQDAFEIGDRWG